MTTPSTPLYNDIQNTLQLEKDYLSRLYVSPKSGSVSDTDITGMNEILKNVNNMSNDLSSNYLSGHILAKLSDVNNIVTTETTRLEEKKRSMEDIINSKKRAIELNENYAEKTHEYTKIIILFVIGLAIWIALILINNYLFPLPDWLVTTVLICVFLVIIFISLNIYLKILSRDKMDFNKIDINPPATLTQDQIANQINLAQKQSQKGGNLFDTTNVKGAECVGSTCCSTGTKWDVTKQSCIKEGFASYSPNEFENYSAV